ncbi:MAG: glycosyltransferase [Deltaproteobacteria bacterium]|nr:glycosyltransferase [Deltaproteobacteria bacterium]
MTSPLVSIILFAHAPFARFVPASLSSILGQSYARLEVLVLGDGSQEIQAAVETFKHDGRVRLCSQGNQPFLQAANDYMLSCGGRYIGTWNSDDLYNQDHVKLLVDVLEEHPESGGAFDNVEYFEDSSGASAGSDDDRSTPKLILSAEEGERLASSVISVQRIFADNIMTGPSSLIRKEAFLKVGGYDPAIYLNCDLHWFYRIGAYFPFRYVNYIGVRKRIHPANNTAVNPHYEFGVRELENIRDCYPDVFQRIGKTVFDKKLGRKYYRLGLYFEKTGDQGKAGEMYGKAMALRRFSLRYRWEYLRLTFLRQARMF